MILSGCQLVNQNQAEDIENLLKEKYQMEFKVTHIGGRYGNGGKGTVTGTAHPIDNKEISFRAVMSREGELVSDGYIPSLISEQINQLLKNELRKKGLEIESKTLIMKANSSTEIDSNITIEEYVMKYKPGYFSGDMIVKETSEDITPEDFDDALKVVYKEGSNTMSQFHIHIISKNDYENTLENFNNTSSYVSDAWFLDYDVVKEMKVWIDPKGFQILEEDNLTN